MEKKLETCEIDFTQPHRLFLSFVYFQLERRTKKIPRAVFACQQFIGILLL